MICANRLFFTVFASTLLIAVPCSVRAGLSAPQNTPAPLPPAQGRATGSGSRTVITAAASPKWLDSKIDLDFKDASIPDAIKKVMEAAKSDSDTVDSDVTFPSSLKVSLKANDVTARDVLAAVARLGGALAYITDKDGKATVWLRKRTPQNAPVIWTTSNGSGSSISVDVQRQVEDAIAMANRASRQATGEILAYTNTTRRLPDRRVSLDVKNSDVRDVLKTLMKQTGLDYVLEGDVPDNTKKSFTFENIPVGMALDVVCESAGIGWRAERTTTTTTTTTTTSSSEKKDDKLVIRIGKKYAKSSLRLNGSTSFIAPFAEALTAFDTPASSFTPFAPLSVPLPVASPDL